MSAAATKWFDVVDLKTARCATTCSVFRDIRTSTAVSSVHLVPNLHRDMPRRRLFVYVLCGLLFFLLISFAAAFLAFMGVVTLGVRIHDKLEQGLEAHPIGVAVPGSAFRFSTFSINSRFAVNSIR